METNLVQGSESWHSFRRTRVMATDSSVILGINPWCTPLTLYKRKKGLIPEQSQNTKMTEGSLMEGSARLWAEHKLNTTLVPTVRKHPIYDFLAASLDGLSLDEKTLVEIKCGKKSFEDALQNKIADYYIAQVQHQMMVTGLDKCHYVAFNGTEGIIIEVQRDDDYIEKMFEMENEFYECLQTNTPPSLSEDDRLKVTVDFLDKDLIESWIEVSKRIEDLEIQEEMLKKQIIELGDDSNVDFVDELGEPLIALTRVNRDGNVDWKALCKAKDISDEEIELYRKKSIGYYKISRKK